MKCSMKNAICELRAAGWRIYLDGRSTAPDGVPWNFLPWGRRPDPGVRGCRTGAEVRDRRPTSPAA
jgi:hypothetical protein